MTLPRALRWALPAVSAASFLCALAVGCGDPPPPKIDPAAYKAAKQRNDEFRAKEYGRRSITDKKATIDRPKAKGKR